MDHILVSWTSASTMHQQIQQQLGTGHIWCTTRLCIRPTTVCYMYINDLDTNIVSKIFKFANDTKLCNRARNPDNIWKLLEDINKLVEWANKWQMNLNVDKYSVMHIGYNKVQGNYSMSNQQLQTTEQNQSPWCQKQKCQNQKEMSCKTASSVMGLIAD